MHTCVVVIEEGLEKGIFMKADIPLQYTLSDNLRNWFKDNNVIIMRNALWTRSYDNKSVIFHFDNDEDAMAFKLKWL